MSNSNSGLHLVCPICSGNFKIDIEEITSLDQVRGAAMDCPHCGKMLYVTDDSQLVDFAPILTQRYQEMGVSLRDADPTQFCVEYEKKEE